MSPSGPRWRHTPRDGDNVDEIGHKESVYNSILYTPPISRHEHGHYWTRDVFIMFTIFWVNIVLQGGLTFIVGRHILKNHAEFLSNLIQDAPAEHPAWVSSEVTRELEKQSEGIQDSVFSGNEGAATPSCCRGPECALLDLPCCAPRVPASKEHAISFEGRQTNASGAVLAQQRRLTKQARTSDHKFLRKAVEAVQGSVAKERSDALCTRESVGDKINCSPYTLSFIDHWHELDANRDGIWTRDEAVADDANLACRLGVPVQDVFLSACRGLVEDARDAARISGLDPHPLIKAVEDRVAMPEEYFRWWSGLVAICRATDVAYCGQLVKRGIFDGAMNPSYGGARGGVTGMDSVMNYCARLLEPGGLCETALPGTYTLFRERVADTCGKHQFSKGGRYNSPFDTTDVMAIVEVEYDTLQSFQGTRHWEFRIFMFLILFIWFSNLVDEVKDLLQLGDFVKNFPLDHRVSALHPRLTTPKAALDSKDDVVERADGLVEVRRISTVHWWMCCLMLIVRTTMIFYMGYAGTYFLLSDHSVVDLLMNSAALAFVFALDEFLYALMVSDATKQKLETVLPLRFRSSLPQQGTLALFWQKSTWGLLGIPVICFVLIYLHEWYETRPIVEALECVCMLQGPRCAGAEVYSKSWWDSYWKETSILARK